MEKKELINVVLNEIETLITNATGMTWKHKNGKQRFLKKMRSKVRVACEEIEIPMVKPKLTTSAKYNSAVTQIIKDKDIRIKDPRDGITIMTQNKSEKIDTFHNRGPSN